MNTLPTVRTFKRRAQLRVRLLSLAAALAAAASPAWSLDLLQTWQAAAGHDPEFLGARAALEAGHAQGREAGALWGPTVSLQAGVARAASETSMNGAQFSAPGFGQSTGVDFATSVTGGTSTRYGIELRQPLYNAERRAQQQQLRAGEQAAEAGWRGAEQELMLRSAQRYFEAALAQRQLELLRQQETSVDHARVEAQDRFQIGDRPITDVHEADARAAALKAQRIAAANDLEVKRVMLADLMGTVPAESLLLPVATPALPALGSLQAWLDRVGRDNPQVRMAQAQLRSAQEEANKTAAPVSATLDLVAQATRDHLQGSGDFGSASNTSAQRAIGIQFSAPLYTGGWRTARHDEAVALVDKARAEVERTRLQATQQARAAWLDVTAAQERIAALEAAVKAGDARLDATRTGLQAGDRTTLDLLNAQNDASAAQLSLLQGRATMITQWLRLSALAGALDESQLAVANTALLGR
jgi:outer membrane protein